ncbi:hypothetical protein GGF31_001553 [Allomyces arbusculus]|nr:hypothetical protein GGF31_001553 [Allomyces arbusculus]
MSSPKSATVGAAAVPTGPTAFVLVARKRDVIDAHAYTSIHEALLRMDVNAVGALPVWGERAHWIAAGGVVPTEEGERAHADRVYIGIVSSLDIAAWLVSLPQGTDIGDAMRKTRIVDVVGMMRESRSLWIAPSSAEFVGVMEPLAKGLHRWLIECPAPSGNPTDPGVFRLCTQTDVIRYLHGNPTHFPHLAARLPESLATLGLATRPSSLHSVSPRTPALHAVRTLIKSQVSALAVIADGSHHDVPEGAFVGTLSADHLRNADVLRKLAVVQPPEAYVVSQLLADAGSRAPRDVTARASEALGDVLARMVNSHAHRAWLVEDMSNGSVKAVGVVALTDVIRVALQAVVEDMHT